MRPTRRSLSGALVKGSGSVSDHAPFSEALPNTAALRYNCLSMIIASMACRLLLIPDVGVFRRFGFFHHIPGRAGGYGRLRRTFSDPGPNAEDSEIRDRHC